MKPTSINESRSRTGLPQAPTRGQTLARRLLPAAIALTALMSPLAVVPAAMASPATTAATAGTGAPAGHQPGHSVLIHANRTAGQPTVIRPSSHFGATRLPRFNLRQRAADLHLPAGAPAAPAPRVAPKDLRSGTPSITANFDGIAYAEAQDKEIPEDPSVATNGSQIMETSADRITVFNSGGSRVCATIPTNRLMTAPGQETDQLDSPQVLYDSANSRFVMFAVDLTHADGGDDPAAFFVAVSATSDPCGSWFPYFFQLPDTNLGDLMVNTSLGQTARSVLVGFTDHQLLPFSDRDDGYAFAIPKGLMYNDGPAAFSVPIFNVASGSAAGVAAVDTAGNPMISSPSAWFLRTGINAVLGGVEAFQGYTLFRMDGDGTATPTITLQSSFTAGFSTPADPGLPGTSAHVQLNPIDRETGLDLGVASAGNIQASPVYDGSRIWFAQTTAENNGPATTVRYGYVTTTGGTLSFAQARHDATSADFNPSIGIGLGTGGIENIFLNWATTDPSQGIPLSPTVATLTYNGGLLAPVIGADQRLAGSGTPAADVSFSSRSAVAVDPAASSGTCAYTGQDYVGSGELTRVARVCAPSQATVPVTAGDTVAAAQAALRTVLLAGDNQVTTTACAAASNHLVVGTTPAAGQLAPIGSEVTLTVCNLDLTVPNVVTFDDANAQHDIVADGFTVGTIAMVSNCDVNAGDVVKQDPRGNTVALRGTAINLQESTGLDPKGKPCVIR